MAYAAQFECQINTENLIASEGVVNSSKYDPRRQGTGKKKNSGKGGKLDVYKGGRKSGKVKKGKGGSRGKSVQNQQFQDVKAKQNAKLTNVQELVQNFEQGLTLKQLRAELEASKASMNASNNFIMQSMSNLKR